MTLPPKTGKALLHSMCSRAFFLKKKGTPKGSRRSIVCNNLCKVIRQPGFDKDFPGIDLWKKDKLHLTFRNPNRNLDFRIVRIIKADGLFRFMDYWKFTLEISIDWVIENPKLSIWRQLFNWSLIIMFHDEVPMPLGLIMACGTPV